MSDILYFTIILIISPAQVDVIYNEVTVEQFKNHLTGIILRKSYANLKNTYLDSIYPDTETFSKGQKSEGVNFNLSANGGALQDFLKPYNPTFYSQADINAYAVSKKASSITDELYVSFAQDKSKLNIIRK